MVIASLPRAAAVSSAVVLMIASASAARADEVLRFPYQGIERQAALHQPTTLGAGPSPLVVALHGLGQTADGLRGELRLDATADREHFRVLYPDAVDKQWSYGRPINQPMPKAGAEIVDDAGFIRALIDQLTRRKLADPARIYVVGVSRGALMAYTLACALDDRIAAVAPLLASMTEFQRADCHPKRALPIMVM